MKRFHRLGIYGGTFAPVHYGHVRAADAFLKSGDLDWMLIMPSRIPPHKTVTWDDCPERRLAMLRLAFADDPRYDETLRISDYELKNEGPSYTIRTVRHFLDYAETVVLLCGTDMFLTLEGWYESEELLRSAEFVCALRSDSDEDLRAVYAAAERYTSRYGTVSSVLDLEPFPVSSTEIRERFARGEDLSALVPSKVLAYMKVNHLYQIVGDPDGKAN